VPWGFIAAPGPWLIVAAFVAFVAFVSLVAFVVLRFVSFFCLKAWSNGYRRAALDYDAFGVRRVALALKPDVVLARVNFDLHSLLNAAVRSAVDVELKTLVPAGRIVIYDDHEAPRDMGCLAVFDDDTPLGLHDDGSLGLFHDDAARCGPLVVPFGYEDAAGGDGKGRDYDPDTEG
jgi:hypothetical protein